MSAPAIPNVLHARGIPCGVKCERGVTHEPHPGGFSDVTGAVVVSPTPNCPDCLAAIERHAALCARVRYGSEAA